MKKIMILGGDKNQLPLIKKAKEIGLYIILCDFRDYVPGSALSDVHYQINTLNPELLIQVGNKERPDGILTNSEPSFVSIRGMEAKNSFLVGAKCTTYNPVLSCLYLS